MKNGGILISFAPERNLYASSTFYFIASCMILAFTLFRSCTFSDLELERLLTFFERKKYSIKNSKSYRSIVWKLKLKRFVFLLQVSFKEICLWKLCEMSGIWGKFEQSQFFFYFLICSLVKVFINSFHILEVITQNNK